MPSNAESRKRGHAYSEQRTANRVQMAEESKFVDLAHAAAEQVLRHPLYIERGAVLLYQITVDNKLETTVDPKKPKRGDSAFQTDLCVFEKKSNDINLPRVVLEFKAGISTHDV